MEQIISLIVDGKEALCVTNVVFGDNYIVIHTHGEDLRSWKKNGYKLGKKYNIRLCTNGNTIRLTYDKKFVLQKIESNIKEATENLVPINYKYYFYISE